MDGAAADAFLDLVADIADDDQAAGRLLPLFRVEAAREEGDARRRLVAALPGDKTGLAAMGAAELERKQVRRRHGGGRLAKIACYVSALG